MWFVNYTTVHNKTWEYVYYISSHHRIYNLPAKDLKPTYILHIKSNFCVALQVAETLDIPDAAAAISCISKENVGNGAL